MDQKITHDEIITKKKTGDFIATVFLNLGKQSFSIKFFENKITFTTDVVPEGYYQMDGNTIYLIWNTGVISKFSYKPNNIYYYGDSPIHKCNLSDNVIDILQENLFISPKYRIPQNVNQFDPFNMWIVNLEHRSDRKKIMIQELSNQYFFNPIFVKAYRHHNGIYGCALSHLTLIRFAMKNKLPYIIIAEDDNQVLKYELLQKIVLELRNRKDWMIFNGGPTFWDRRDDLEDVHLYPLEGSKDLILSNWGQTTNFIIYNKRCYEKMLNYKFDQHIDQYISKTFLQTIYSNCVVARQRNNESDITGKFSDMDNCYYTTSDLLLTKIREKQPTIGIFGIFIGRYIFFLDKFLKNIESNFLPQYKKVYYLVTDSTGTDKNSKILRNMENVFINYQSMIGWPYETLYRYKYFNKFSQKEIEKSDIIYFINSNAHCADIIGSEVFPDESGHVFTIHNGYVDKGYEGSTFEKDNKNSKAYIGPDIENCSYTYFGGRFFGAVREKFKEMCAILEKNIEEDEKNEYIAEWHDESHLNHYCLVELKEKFKKLGIEYHIPDEILPSMKKSHQPKMIYFDKNKFIAMKKNDKSKFNQQIVTHGKIIMNRHNRYLFK
jgi:hypothetical protein